MQHRSARSPSVHHTGMKQRARTKRTTHSTLYTAGFTASSEEVHSTQSKSLALGHFLAMLTTSYLEKRHFHFERIPRLLAKTHSKSTGWPPYVLLYIRGPSINQQTPHAHTYT